jgi:serine/threonine-protein kinase
VAADASKSTLDGFRSLKPLGSTELWDSFSGYSEQLKQEVNLALVAADALKEEVLRQKFTEAARAATTLRHPMLSRCLLATPLPDGRWSVVSEPVQGPTLAQYLSSHGKLSGDDAVKLCALLCEALDAAHQRGLLHGDIRPEHVELPGGLHKFTPKLNGFALGLLKPARVKGYSAPELAQRREPTALTDLYSLGALLWACLTGSPPSDFDVEKLPPLPEDEEHLLPVLKKALNRDFTKRYFSAGELGRALTKANGTFVPPPDKPTDRTTPMTSGEASTDANALGTMMGPYELVKLLGEGSMGQVFLGRHKALGRQVAIKVLRPEQYSRGDLVQRFFQEARTVNQINHEHIVEIFDFVQEPGPQGPSAVYCVMELLSGESLAAVIEKGPVALQRSISIVRQLCDALYAAHKVGVVHRDVKPDNIFLIERAWQRDYVKVLDFGVAKLMHADPDAPLISTMDGAIIGTPMCMAPEQAAGQAVDWRADIYATGVILYLLLTGRLPFDAKNFASLAVQLITQPPPPIGDTTPSGEAISPELKAAVLKCLEKDPKARPQSMKELSDALAPFVSSQPETPGATTVPIRMPKGQPAPSTGGRWVALVAVLAVLGAAGALVFMRPWEGKPVVAVVALQPPPQPPEPVQPPQPPQPVEPPAPVEPPPEKVEPPPAPAPPEPPTPRPQLKPVQLTAGMIQETVSHGSRDVSRCFDKYRSYLKDAEGHVDVTMTIDLSGAVSGPKVASEGLAGSALEGCLIREVKKLHFPKHTPPAPTIKVPFKYKLTGGG